MRCHAKVECVVWGRSSIIASIPASMQVQPHWSFGDLSRQADLSESDIQQISDSSLSLASGFFWTVVDRRGNCWSPLTQSKVATRLIQVVAPEISIITVNLKTFAFLFVYKVCKDCGLLDECLLRPSGLPIIIFVPVDQGRYLDCIEDLVVSMNLDDTIHANDLRDEKRWRVFAWLKAEWGTNLGYDVEEESERAEMLDRWEKPLKYKYGQE